MSLRADFLAFDDRLASVGVPPLTPWWRAGIGEWLDAFEGQHVLEFWACVGRGSAKSTALYKLAAFWTLFVPVEVPVGERHFAIILSRLKEEAGKGVQIIKRWLDLLAVGHSLAGDVIEVGERRGIRVVAASVAGASGWRAYFVGKDERSKWAASGIEERDAAEIDASANAMTSTHALAPMPSFGSAWVREGSFYEAIASGTDSSKVVLGPTPTWIAAPHITEESTRKKERDPRRWAREYLCDFQQSALAAFDREQVDKAFAGGVSDLFLKCWPILLLDPSAGSADTYTWAVIRQRNAPEHARYLTRRVWVPGGGYVHNYLKDEHDQRIANPDWRDVVATRVEFVHIHGIEQAARKGHTSDSIVRHIAQVCRQYGCVAIHSDQFERFALASAIGRYGIPFVPHTWTAPLKERATERLRAWLRDGVLSLPKHDRMRSEFLNFEERIAPSGAMTFRGRQGSHDDYVMLALLAALVDIEGQLPGSPLAPRAAKPLPRGLVA